MEDTKSASKKPVKTAPEKPEPTTGKSEAPQKSKKGLVAAIICLLVLAAAGVAAVILLTNNNKPENVVLDAVTKTIKSPTHTVSGKIELTTKTESALTNSSVTSGRIIVELDGRNSGLNNTASATVTVKTAGTSDFVFRFSEVFQDGGVLYLKTSDLVAFADSAVDFFEGQLEASGMTSNPFANIMTHLKSVARKADNTWWRVSLSEIIKSLGVNDQNATKQYDCVIGAVKDLFSDSGLSNLADTYQKYPFITAASSDNKPASFSDNTYEASINTTELARFWNSFVTSDNATKISDCLPKDQSTTILDPVVSEDFAPLAGKTIYLDVDQGHNLSGVYASGSSESYGYLVDLRLDSEADAIEAPSDARPVSELLNDVMPLIQSFYGLYTVAE